jgi:CRISPR/Cas system CMR-associated protein Cmr1 (group 7 of RAMP superfamily)
MSGEKMGGVAPRSQRKARQQLDQWTLTFRLPLPLSINIITVLFPATLFELFPLGNMLAVIQRGVGGFHVCEQRSGEGFATVLIETSSKKESQYSNFKQGQR